MPGVKPCCLAMKCNVRQLHRFRFSAMLFASLRCRQFLGFGSTQATLLAAALFAACLAGPQLAEAAKCTRYRGSGCHFTVRHNEPVLFPACLSNCRFEVRKAGSDCSKVGSAHRALVRSRCWALLQSAHSPPRHVHASSPI